MKNKNLLLTVLMLLLSFFTGTLNSQTADRHVILVIIDGARYSETLGDTSGKYIPRMKALGRQGTVIDSFYNDGITYTDKAVPAIWSGSWATPVDTILPGNISSQYAAVPTIWEYYRKTTGKDSTHAMYILKYLRGPWMSSKHPEYGPKYWPWYVLQGTRDLDVWQSAREKYKKYHPEFSVLYLSDVDHYGHSGNWNDYLKAITVADSIVGMLWDFVQADSVFRDKTDIIITNDHGRHSDGIKNGFVSHGDNCSGCRHIMLLAAGPDFKKGIHLTKRRNIPDIVPTVGELLNFPTPYAAGSVMTELISAPVRVKSVTESERKYTILYNYPNPFNPSTKISYSVKADSYVKIAVYNSLGELIEVPVDLFQASGAYEFTWNAGSNPAGMYILSFNAASVDGKESFQGSRKMILVK